MDAALHVRMREAIEGLGQACEEIAGRLREWEAKGLLRPILPPSVSLRTRYIVLRRDAYRCRLCGLGAEDDKKLEVDHRQPRSKGGTNSLDNLWTLCFECNRGKGNLDL